MDQIVLERRELRSKTQCRLNAIKPKEILKLNPLFKSKSYSHITETETNENIGITKFTGQFEIQYEIQEKIGKGFQATVYKVSEKKTKINYAAKIYQTFDAELIQKIKKENKILQSLDHPNIIKHKDFYCNEENGIYIIVTEYHAFITLKSFLSFELSERTTFEWIKLRDLFRRILLCVLFIHQRKIIHRDLNIENILICPITYEFKIIDFGVAVDIEIQDYVFNDEGNVNYRLKYSDYSPEEPWTIDFWGLGLILLGFYFQKDINSRQAHKIYEEKKRNIIEEEPELNQTLLNLLGKEKFTYTENAIEKIMGMQ